MRIALRKRRQIINSSRNEQRPLCCHPAIAVKERIELPVSINRMRLLQITKMYNISIHMGYTIQYCIKYLIAFRITPRITI